MSITLCLVCNLTLPSAIALAMRMHPVIWTASTAEVPAGGYPPIHTHPRHAPGLIAFLVFKRGGNRHAEGGGLQRTTLPAFAVPVAVVLVVNSSSSYYAKQRQQVPTLAYSARILLAHLSCNHYRLHQNSYIHNRDLANLSSFFFKN
jgi:hypothetical protein